MRRFAKGILATAGAALMLAGCHKIGNPQPETGLGAGDDWPSVNADQAETAYSKLTLIDSGNVGNLGLAWSLDLPGEVTLEATPIKVGALGAALAESKADGGVLVAAEALDTWTAGTRLDVVRVPGPGPVPVSVPDVTAFVVVVVAAVLAAAFTTVLSSCPLGSERTQSSGVADDKRPPAKSVRHFLTILPCAFATFRTPWLKAVIQRWSSDDTCAVAAPAHIKPLSNAVARTRIPRFATRLPPRLSP